MGRHHPLPVAVPPVGAFGNLLRRFRQRAGLTQEELAERADLSARSISDLERGVKHAPQRATVRLLISALGLTGDEQEQLERSIQRRRGAYRIVSAGGSTVPEPLTPLVGRQRDAAEAVHRLRWGGVRLLTLTGAGGVGKTRVAIDVAHALRHDFPEGLFYVSLASLRDTALLDSAIVGAMGLKPSGSRSAEEVLLSHLREREALLVLDNFEQLLGAAGLLSRLLQECGRIKLLVTSRAALKVHGEHRMEIAPLDVPGDRQRSNLEVVARYPAVDLFVQRAQAVRRDFGLNESNVEAVAEICRRLDGLPLAGSGESDTAQEHHAHYFLVLAERAVPRLTSEHRDLWFAQLDAEQDNLRAALHWSLEQGAVELGLRLGGALWRYWLERGYSGEGRSWLQRVLALDRAARSPIPVRAQALFAAGALAYTQSDYALATDLYDQSLALQREAGDDQAIATVLNALGVLTSETGAYDQAQEYLEESIALRRKEGPTHGLGAALNNLAQTTRYQGDLRRAASLYEECLAVYQACGLGKSPATANTWNNLAQLAMHQGEYERARRLSEESLALARETGFPSAMAEALSDLGDLAIEHGALEIAEARYQEALAISRSVGDKGPAALTLANLANLARARGDYGRARRLGRESLEHQEEIGNERGVAYALFSLGATAREQEDRDEADASYRRALSLNHKIGYLVGIAECLERLAWLGSSRQEPGRAAMLGGAAEALREKMGLVLTPTEEAQHRELLGDARQELEEMGRKAPWNRGRAMSLDEVVASALAGRE